MSKTVNRFVLAAALALFSAQSLAIDDQARIQAAQATARNHSACTSLSPFYWEIGDRIGVLASGTRGLLPPQARTQMAIYSAGKWIDAAYVFQQRGGLLRGDDISALNMTAGYTAQGQCPLSATVADCQKALATRDPAAIGKFFYGPGHFQKHAAIDLGLAKLKNTELSAEILKGLGNGLLLSYNQPHLAGGARSSAADYAIFLRRILNGPLLLGVLGSHAVCTYTGATDASTGRQNCPTALSSPASDPALGLLEAWHYSLGHWVEDDPVSGDGAFSSPGAAGFYPWIDADRQYYGVLARMELTVTASTDSVKCGRLIRQAWLSGTAPADAPKALLPKLTTLLPR